jgi:predicted  nucleic acid-binding Zn-ribbon protein|tara:strand:+ start:528 stop:803 length:276 start_codon:yes stop_codon:yes gene_type:complete
MSQISDLFKRIKELEEQIQQNKDQQDKDYQNALDKARAVETAQDSLKTNMVHINTKIDTIDKRLDKIEEELGIEEKKTPATVPPGFPFGFI